MLLFVDYSYVRLQHEDESNSNQVQIKRVVTLGMGECEGNRDMMRITGKVHKLVQEVKV